MSTRVGSLLSKSKKRKKKKEEEATSRRKEKEKGNKMKKGNVDKPICNCIWAFLSKNDV